MLMLAAILFPPSRLTSVLTTGEHGCNTAVFAGYCRSYHRAPLEWKSLLPVFHRAADGSIRPSDLYTSQLCWPYLLWAGITAIIGTSEEALRLLAASVTFLGALLLGRLMRDASPLAAFVTVFLYATSPLTLVYGTMMENTLLAGLGLALAAWGASRFLTGNLSQLRFFLLSLPLALTAIHLFAFFLISFFIVAWALSSFSSLLPATSSSHLPSPPAREEKKGWREAVHLTLPLALVGIGLLSFHLMLVYAAAGSLQPFFFRASERSLWNALSEGWDPLLLLARHLFERLGAPLFLLATVAMIDATRQRREHPDRFVFAWIGGGSCLLYVMILLQIVTHHRYMLQVCLPTASLLAGPIVETWWSSCRRRDRIVGVLFLLTALILGIHAHSRWKAPRDFHRDLATFAQEAGEHAGERGRVLLIARGELFGQLMVAQYYCRATVDLVRMGRDPIEISGYAAILVLQAREEEWQAWRSRFAWEFWDLVVRPDLLLGKRPRTRSQTLSSFLGRLGRDRIKEGRERSSRFCKAGG